MFDQQEYINKYIKENYKTIKIRISNKNKAVINKLENVDNMTKYIIDLITKDIYSNREYNFINNDIKIDFDLSITLKDLVDKAEEADLLNDYGLYMNIVDAIDCQAKLEVSNHILNNYEWNILIRRYCM